MSVSGAYSTLMHELFGAHITIMWVQEHARVITNCKEKAKKLSSYIATYSDESVNLQEVSLKLHTLYLEKSPVLLVLSIENFSESVESNGCKQMTSKQNPHNAYV